MIVNDEIKSIVSQIVELISPKSVILFGSQSKGTARKKSDIDLCIIKNTNDKKNLLIDAYINIESTKPFDLVLYTEDEWISVENEPSSFAHIIKKWGTVVYGIQSTGN